MFLHFEGQLRGENEVPPGGDHQGSMMVYSLWEVGFQLPVSLASLVVVETTLESVLLVLANIIIKLLQQR